MYLMETARVRAKHPEHMGGSIVGSAGYWVGGEIMWFALQHLTVGGEVSELEVVVAWMNYRHVSNRGVIQELRNLPGFALQDVTQS